MDECGVCSDEQGRLDCYEVKVTATLSELQECLEEWDDLDARIIYLRGTIPSEYSESPADVSIDEIVGRIRGYNREDSGIEKEHRQPIRLFIDSCGGDMFAGFKLVDAISASVTPVYTINESQCASMAFLIFITGHKRYSTERAIFHMHDGNLGVSNSTNKVVQTVDFYREYEDAIVKPHILEHGTMSEDEYETAKLKEYYMLAPKAANLGFVDEIITLDNCQILY